MKPIAKIPHSVESEKAVIGALLIKPKVYPHINEILTKESFYLEKNRAIYEAIEDLVLEDKPVDIVTVTEQLKSSGKLDIAGGMKYVVSINKEIATSTNFKQYALIVKEKQLRRDVIRLSQLTIKKASDETNDILTEIEKLEENILNIGNERHRQDRIKSGIEIINETQAYINRLHDNENELIQTGLTDLDDQIMIEKGQVVVIGGRPGMGKTALGLNIAENVAKNKKVLFVSIEMPSVAVTLRRVSYKTGYSYRKLLSQSYRDVAIEELESFKNKDVENLLIDDRSDYSTNNLKFRIERFVREQGIEMVVFDYLQLMQGIGSSKREQVSSLSNSIKRMAKDLNITAIVLAQLNREGGDPKKDPTMRDLKEAGEIEQDGDIIILINRPEEYGVKEINLGNKKVSSENIAKLIIAKQKNGEANNIILSTYLKNRMKFENYISE